MQREFVRESPSHRALTVFLAAGLILTGTSTSYETGQADLSDPTTELFKPGTPAYDTFDALPHGACDESFTEPADETEVEEAQACVASHNGEIAVVDFTGHLDLAKAVAYQAEAALPAITRGVIHPRLVVMEASPEAQADYASSTANNGCISARRPDRYAAAAAERTMSAAVRASYIMADTSRFFCDPRTLGATDQIRQRLSDIKFPEDPNLHDPKSTANELARRQIHEILHFYGVGHSGSIAPAAPKTAETPTLSDVVAANDGMLDVQKYTAGCVYAEYDDPSSVMGRTAADKLASTRLNPVNESALTDAVAVAANRPSSARQIGDAPITIIGQDSIDGALAILSFESPIAVTDSLIPTIQEQFSRLAIVPYVDRNAGETHISGIDIGLIANGNNFASLGRIPVSESGTTFSLVIDGRTITLIASPSGVKIAKR